MPRFVPLSSAGALCLLLSSCALSPGDSDRITAHDSHIVVREDGSIRVTETIEYDFGTLPSAGLLWEIPVGESDGFLRHRVMEFSDIEVSSPSGAPDVIENQELGRGWLTLEIGDSSEPVTGVHGYAVSYTVHRALTEGDEGARLHWNVVGDGWGVPVRDVTATVEAPHITGVDCAYWYEEQVGDDVREGEADCDRSRHDADSATFAQETLQPGAPMSVIVELAEDGVTVPEPEYGMAPLPRWLTLIGVLSLVVAVVLSVGLLHLIHRFQESFRRRARERLPDAPVDLPAAVAGFHWNKAELRAEHVLALLVSLEEKGHVTSEPGKKKAKDGSTNWVFVERESPEPLSPAERALKRAMFAGHARVGLHRLGRALNASRVKRISRALHRECVSHGLRPRAWIFLPLAVVYLGALLAAFFAPSFVNEFTPLNLSGLEAFSVGLVAISAVFLWMPSPMTTLGERVRSRLGRLREGPEGLDPVLAIAVGSSDEHVDRLARAAPHTRPYYRDHHYRKRWNNDMNRRIRAARRRKGSGGGGGRVAGGGGGGSGGGRR